MRSHTHARTQERTIPLYTLCQVPAPTQQVGPQWAMAPHRLCSYPISFLGVSEIGGTTQDPDLDSAIPIFALVRVAWPPASNFISL